MKYRRSGKISMYRRKPRGRPYKKVVLSRPYMSLYNNDYFLKVERQVDIQLDANGDCWFQVRTD